MSTTNVPPVPPKPDDSVPGSQPDDHGGIGPPSAEAVRLKYEPDGYDSTSVISVPILVVLFFVLAFATTTVLFGYFTRPDNDPGVHPMAAERNQVPINDRLARSGRGGIGTESDKPRLEPLRQRSGYPQAITSPEAGQNPPYLSPQDIQADKGRTPELFRTGPVGNGFSRVPLDKVIAEADKGLFKAVPKGQSLPIGSTGRATAANAGRSEPPRLPAAPAPKDVKKDEPKKDEKKEPPKGGTPGGDKK